MLIFASDNGAINDCPLHGTDQYPGWQEDYPRLGSNAPYRGVKAQLYEGGIRTPTIVNWRGQLAPGTIDHPVHVVDWMPTLSELVDARPRTDPRWDGIDIWPLISGLEQEPPERCIYWNFRRGSHLGVRRGGWKLISSQGEGKRTLQLFDIAADPHERDELSGDAADLVGELSSLIRDQRALDDTSKRTDIDSSMLP